MKYRISAVLIIIASALLCWGLVLSQKEGNALSARFPFSLGLDLVGGTELVYRADVSDLSPGDVSGSLSVLRDVIERRVNVFGVSEPLVQRETADLGLGAGSEERLLVELPGITDVSMAVAQIGATPVLEFMLERDGAQASLLSALSSGREVAAEDIMSAFASTGLTGRFLSRAQLVFDPTTGAPAVNLTFNDEGRELFRSITENNIGKILGIFLDGAPVSLPVIQSPIYDGSADITGTFTASEARSMVENLNYGALPVPIELIGSQKVGPTLGRDALTKGLLAGLIGTIAISLFLILWYRVPGIVAVVALGIYVIMSLALFKLIPVTLTAAGIAGFVLSIGMAIDSNILIFERMKEELARGRSIKDSAEEGFRRAWLSIRDSNTSTIITATVLFWIGTSAIKGFALVLGLGVFVSLLTAITISRTLLFAVIPAKDSSAGRFLFSAGVSSGKTNDNN